MKSKLSFLVFCISASIFGQTTDSRLSGAAEEIQDILKAYNAAGLSVAILENNEIIYAKGFGFRDFEKKLPVTENTVFPIGSITKSFTSCLIGMLADQGQLSINEKPAAYIPGLQFYDDRMNSLITLEDLLAHRSGIGAVDGSYLFFPAANRLELMKRTKYLKPNGAVKDSWIYSNFGYAMLGSIVEQVSQKSWEENTKEKIFKPLGMDHSSVSIIDMTATKDYSFGYGISNNKMAKVLFGELHNDKCGGGINSTAVDMAHWMKLWLNKGSYDNKAILSGKYVRDATSMKAIYNGAPPDSIRPGNYLYGYGYGLNVNSYKGHYRVHHGGAVSGFSSDMVMFPTDKLGIIVLTNQHNTDLPYVVANMLSNRLLKLADNKPYAFEPEIHDVILPEKEIKLVNKDKKPTHSLADYCGKYANAGYGTFEISLEKNILYATFPGYKLRMEHQQYDVFMLKLIEDMPQVVAPEFDLNFLTDYEGNISSVNIDFQRDDVNFTKADKK